MSNTHAIGTGSALPQRSPGKASIAAMVEAPRARFAAGSRAVDLAEAALLLLVLAALAIRFILVFRLNINWDEFYFLSLVHDHLRGSLTSPFQTFHVHLFAWLPAIFSDEISQIFAARTVMATLVVVDAVLLYGIGRRFLSRPGALFGLLAYFSFGYVFGHGASFRVDPMLTTLLLVSFHAVLRWPGNAAAAVVAGVAGALATIVSVKSAFHLTTIGVVYLCLIFAAEVRRPVAAAAALFALAFACALATLFAAHRFSLAAPPTTGIGDFLGGAAAKVLSGSDLQRPLLYLAADYVRSLPVWALLLGGIVIARREAAQARGRERAAKLIPLALCLPVLTLLFYRNSFPYYYALALAPGALLTGLAYDRLHAWSAAFLRARRRCAMTAALVATLAVMQLLGFDRHMSDRVSTQRQVIGVVHAAFPEPVPYLDGYGMVASFPWTGFFMSTWGRQNYRAAGHAVLAERAVETAPVLVIADSIPLAAALLGDDRPGVADSRLFPADERFLRDNYLRYWGPLFVAGKRIAVPAATGIADFDILVPGTYRLDAAVPLLLDGRRMPPDATVELARGPHRLATADGTAGEALLLWAGVPPPPPPLPDSCLFVVDSAMVTECALPMRRASASERAWEGPQP